MGKQLVSEELLAAGVLEQPAVVVQDGGDLTASELVLKMLEVNGLTFMMLHSTLFIKIIRS